MGGLSGTADIIYLPVSLFDAVDTGLAPVTVLHALIMVTAPHTVPGQRHHRCIQSVEHIAQLPVPGLSFHFRVKMSTVHQHIPGHALRIVFKPRRVAESAGMQHQTTTTGSTTPYPELF